MVEDSEVSMNPYTREPSYHALCMTTLPLLTPTFEFESAGLSLRPSYIPLLPWLLGSRTSRPVDRIRVEIRDQKERLMSVDGERYKGRSVVGEKVKGVNVFWTC